MTTVPFVDAHVHLWDLAHIRYPWLTAPFSAEGPNGSVEPIAHDYGVPEYRADMSGWNVVGAVHIDAGAHPDEALRETEWLDQLANETGLPSAIVAFAALDDPGVDRILAAHAAYSRVRGIRQIVNWHADPLRTYTPRDVTQDDRWQAGFRLLAAHGLSFDLQCYAGQMAGLAPLFERHPDIPVIINHLGMPVISDADGLTRWRHGLETLSRLPHVAIKLSGFGFIQRDWTVETVAPLVHEVVDVFGTDRCLFASDAPTDKLFSTLDRYLSACRSIASTYSEDERRDMFGRNANRVYRLGLDL